MRKKAEYRSAKRSRDKICDAFLDLLKEKAYEKITVTDIVKNAKINRSTFYAHYPDVDGVLESFEEDTIQKMMNLLEQFHYDGFFDNPMLLLNKVNTYLCQDLERYQILLFQLKSSSRFLHKLTSIFYEYMKQDKSVPKEVRDSLQFDTRIKFFAGGMIEVYERWFLEGRKQDPTLFSKEISEIIKESSAFLQKTSK